MDFDKRPRPNNEFRNWKLIHDPLLKKGVQKLYRFDGVTPAGSGNSLYNVNHVSDPRLISSRHRNRADSINLTIPAFKVDDCYVGKPPSTEVSFLDLNDNISQQFLTDLCKKFGDVEEAKVYFSPKDKRHLGLGRVVFKRVKSASTCVQKYNGVAIMGKPVKAFLDPWGKQVKKLYEELCEEGSAPASSSIVENGVLSPATGYRRSNAQENDSGALGRNKSSHQIHHRERKNSHTPLPTTKAVDPRNFSTNCNGENKAQFSQPQYSLPSSDNYASSLSSTTSLEKRIQNILLPEVYSQQQHFAPNVVDSGTPLQDERADSRTSTLLNGAKDDDDDRMSVSSGDSEPAPQTSNETAHITTTYAASQYLPGYAMDYTGNSYQTNVYLNAATLMYANNAAAAAYGMSQPPSGNQMPPHPVSSTDMLQTTGWQPQEFYPYSSAGNAINQNIAAPKPESNDYTHEIKALTEKTCRQNRGDLKQVLEKDLLKRLIESAAFPLFDSWISTQENLSNILKPKLEVNQTQKGNEIAQSSSSSASAAATSSQNCPYSEGVGTSSGQSGNSNVINGYPNFSSELSSIFGMGFRASLQKLPSFKRKPVKISPPPVQRRVSRQTSPVELETTVGGDCSAPKFTRTRRRSLSSLSSTSSSSSEKSSSKSVSDSESDSDSDNDNEEETAQKFSDHHSSDDEESVESAESDARKKAKSVEMREDLTDSDEEGSVSSVASSSSTAKFGQKPSRKVFGGKVKRKAVLHESSDEEDKEEDEKEEQEEEKSDEESDEERTKEESDVESSSESCSEESVSTETASVVSVSDNEDQSDQCSASSSESRPSSPPDKAKPKRKATLLLPEELSNDIKSNDKENLILNNNNTDNKKLIAPLDSLSPSDGRKIDSMLVPDNSLYDPSNYDHCYSNFRPKTPTILRNFSDNIINNSQNDKNVCTSNSNSNFNDISGAPLKQEELSFDIEPCIFVEKIDKQKSQQPKFRRPRQRKQHFDHSDIEKLILANRVPPKIEEKRPDVIYQPRDALGETQILYDFLTNGLDDEDQQFLRRAYEKMRFEEDLVACSWLKSTHWTRHPPTASPPAKKRRLASDDQMIHKSGSARTEGFYKPPEKLKNTFTRAARQATVFDQMPEQMKASDQVVKQQSREARSNQRRLLSTMGDVESDFFKFNQLKYRKKSIKFSKSKIHGWGLFAMEPIAQDEMVVEYVGQKVRLVVAEKREKQYEKMGIGSSYLFRLDNDWAIDATKRGAVARFINHSCNPSCYAKIINLDGEKRIVIYSKQNISKGEEITYDYKFPIEDVKIPCNCGAHNCRGSLN